MNNPRKPLEASGTSGMKASTAALPPIGDGWWAEGYTGDNGWLIDAQADPHLITAQDWADVLCIYALIEQQPVPAFYDRDAQGRPAPLAPGGQAGRSAPCFRASARMHGQAIRAGDVCARAPAAGGQINHDDTKMTKVAKLWR